MQGPDYKKKDLATSGRVLSEGFQFHGGTLENLLAAGDLHPPLLLPPCFRCKKKEIERLFFVSVSSQPCTPPSLFSVSLSPPFDKSVDLGVLPFDFKDQKIFNHDFITSSGEILLGKQKKTPGSINIFVVVIRIP